MSLNKQRQKNFTKASIDLIAGALKYSLWWSLAWQDIKLRYRRSILGPFWITISTGIMIIAMGPIYGALLGQNISTYLQYLAVSLIIWNFISSCVNDSCLAFIGAEDFIKQISLPLSVYVFRLVTRNLIMFVHNFVIVLVVLFFIPPTHLQNIWMFPLGLFLVVGNLFWLTLLLALICTRFRDIPQLVANFVQVTFFLSPIIWKVDMLNPQMRFLVYFNPFYHFTEVIRGPILGESINFVSWIITGAFLLFGSIFTFFVFARLRSRIPYWL